MSRIDLSAVPTSALRAELARRELASRPADRPKRWKWVCGCGNTAYGGGDLSQVFAEDGRVWCRVCIPSCRRVIYATGDRLPSVPMKQEPA